MKTATGDTYCQLDHKEERTCEAEDRSSEIIQSEESTGEKE